MNFWARPYRSESCDILSFCILFLHDCYFAGEIGLIIHQEFVESDMNTGVAI